MISLVSKRRLKRVLACFTLLFIVFTNYGMPLYAIAAETADLFETSLFKKSEIEMTASFADGKKEAIGDVNESVTLFVELNPTEYGYLKQGNLNLELEDGSSDSFKIAAISQEAEDILNEKYNERMAKKTSEKSAEATQKQAEFVLEDGMQDNSENLENNEYLEQYDDEDYDQNYNQNDEQNLEQDVQDNYQDYQDDLNAHDYQDYQDDLNTHEDDNYNEYENQYDDDEVVNDDGIQVMTDEELEALNGNQVDNTIIDYSNSIDGNNVDVEEVTPDEKEEEVDLNEIPPEVPIYDDTFQSEDLNAVVEQIETIEEIQSSLEEEAPAIITNIEPEYDLNELDLLSSEEVNLDAIIDEEEYIEQVAEETMVESQTKRIFIEASSVTLKTNNQVLIENVSSKTKIYITLTYVGSESINVSNLLSKLNLKLTGTFVNDDLEEVVIGKKDELNLGWKYSHDIELSSEFVKVSPFTVNDNFGSIVENEIKVKRDIKDAKYLPLKSTELKIKVPTLNNKYPMMVDVTAKQLMATTGEKVGEVTFSKENWKYDETNNTITINVVNNKNDVAVNTKGEDVYVITYRFEDYVQGENIELDKNVTLKAEEYSAQINTITKQLTSEEQETIDAGELITYSVDTSKEKITKGPIYANYFVDNKMKTEFSTIVGVKILTQDMIDQVVITNMYDEYIDKNGNGYKADDDVSYSGINLKYHEIEDFLKSGSSIRVFDPNDELIYVFTEDNTKQDSDCQIRFNGEVKDLKVVINNVSSNGSFTVEFLKYIEDTDYSMEQFTSFVKLVSSIRPRVQYIGVEEEFSLKELIAVKDFTESSTKANIYMNPASLNTINKNENVELKIVLNNNTKTSDIYKNPGFEIVYPQYITDVEILNMNISNNEGLRVADFNTYEYDGTLRTFIKLDGTQQKISTANLTNGTNIIINCNITLSEFTPKKEDQIKLYYYNEAVSSYQSQTEWKMNERVPEGILRQTNGFDVAVFEYKAPSGLITATGIRNYDGNLGFVSSVKQGEVTAEIQRNSDSKIAKMELTTLNNTGNPCRDLVLIGRVPFEGNKDIITGEDLGTTVNTTMIDVIKQDGKNPLAAKIYYSNNPEADRNLVDINNNWKTAQELNTTTTIKSYMIIVQGTIKPGATFKYSYDFKIPEGLSFDNEIYGTYAAYYNNILNSSVVYESNSSDKVGLKTPDQPNIEATITNDFGNNTTVKARTRIKYTINVKNTGGIVLNDVKVKVPMPKGLNYMVDTGQTPFSGDFYMEEAASSEERTFEYIIGTMQPDEEKEIIMYAKTTSIPRLEEMADGKDENGYFVYEYIMPENLEDEEELEHDHEHEDEEELEHDHEHEEIPENIEKKKRYLTEEERIINVKAQVESSSVREVFETNEIKNKVIPSNFYIVSSADYADREFYKDTKVAFSANIKNVSGKDLTGTVLSFNTGNKLALDQAIVSIGKIENGTEIVKNEIESATGEKITRELNVIKDELITNSLNSIDIKIGDLKNNDRIQIELYCVTKKTQEPVELKEVYFTVKADGVEQEKGSSKELKFVRPVLKAEDLEDVSNLYFNENDTFTIQTKITNIGEYASSNAKIIENSTANVIFLNSKNSSAYKTEKADGSTEIVHTLPLIHKGESIVVQSKYRTKNLSGTEDFSATIRRILQAEDQDEFELQKSIISVTNSIQTEQEIEEEKIEETRRKNEQEEAVIKAKREAERQAALKEEKERSGYVVNQNEAEITKNNNAQNEAAKQSSQNKANTVNQNTNQQTKTNVKTYAIFGTAWEDLDKNGGLDSKETKLSGIKVSLYNADTKALEKQVDTSESGKYGFSGVKEGNYYVVFDYDKNIYTTTTYMNNGVSENNMSYAISNKTGNASTEVFALNKNITNLNVGLVRVNDFDLEVTKTLTHAKVIYKNGKTIDYDINNQSIYKIEIKSNKLKDAVVELEYTISLKNIGQLAGYAEKLIDIVPKGMDNSMKNKGIWTLGDDGKLYSKDLTDRTIEPGTTRQIKMYLTKMMTEENTGLVSNRVELVSGYSVLDNKKENTDNNSNVQNTFIMPSTGRNTENVIIGVSTTVLAIFAYLILTKKIKIPYINSKKIYR